MIGRFLSSLLALSNGSEYWSAKAVLIQYQTLSKNRKSHVRRMSLLEWDIINEKIEIDIEGTTERVLLRGYY